MRVLAWDVGIINLAFCILQGNPQDQTFQVIDWGIINLLPTGQDYRKVAAEELRLILIRNLDILRDRFLERHLDVVLIENQPVLKNPIMKSISSCIMDYFLIRGMIDSSLISKVVFTSPVNKLKLGIMTDSEITDMQARLKSKYQINKKIAIITCERLLKISVHNDEASVQFGGFKKKDDLADSLLLAYHYLKKNEFRYLQI